jgi:hypothetical protein
MGLLVDRTQVCSFLCRGDSVLVGMAVGIETMEIFCSVKSCNTSNLMLVLVRPFSLFCSLLTCTDHAGVYVPQTGEILIYGGKAYLAEQPRSNKVTWPYKVADDMWYYNFNHCVNNCSLHGVCRLGFCEVTPPSPPPPDVPSSVLRGVLWRRLLEHELPRHLLLLRC